MGSLTKAALAIFCALGASSAAADMADDPLLVNVLVDELEWQVDEPDNLAWDAQMWAGYDLNRIWLKTEGERRNGGPEQASAQLLYGRAVASYWDLQVGWRRDSLPGIDDQDWLAVGLQGLASMEASLRLRYEIRREVAPYVGVNWQRAFGGTADLAAAEGEAEEDNHWVVGIRAWF